MKLARARVRKSRVKVGSQFFSVSKAKTYLGRLIEKASKGETVYIVRGRFRYSLQQVPEIEPVPMRSPGYFAKAYDTAQTRELNFLAKASVLRTPKDLE